MATGATKMSNSNFNYFQNGKYGTMPQKEVEVSQDMHLKMSKKIAQLTKVIYALNTKNDEHEAVVQTIKEQHEDRVQQIYTETRTKIEYYKDKLGDETKHVQRIEALQSCIREHEREKEKVVSEFDSFKDKTSKRESDIKTEHGQKMLDLSQQVLQAKKEFESRLEMVETLQAQVLSDKQNALREQAEQHAAEMESLTNTLKNDTSALSAARDELTSKHKLELERLQLDIARLSGEKKQLGEEYDEKLAKSQAFFDKEMEALRNSQNASGEEKYNNLLEQFTELQKDSRFAEGQSKKRIEDLLHEMAQKELEIENVQGQLRSLQETIRDSNSSSSLLHKQLSEAKTETLEAMSRLKDLETQLIAARERCEQQANELVRKSTSIGQLEATKLQNESTISDLETQLGKLRDRLGLLESSKKALESRSQHLSEDQQNQLKSLQQSLEDVTIEKQKMREQYEREQKSLKESTESEKMRLESVHAELLGNMEKDHRNKLDSVREDSERTLAKLKHDLETLLEEERAKHRTEKLAAQEKYEKLKTELMFKLNQAEEEVSRLSRIVEEHEAGLGSATTQVTSLRDSVDRLKAELDSTRSELRTAKSKLTNVTSDYEKLKVTHESKMKEAEVELKTQLEKMAVDLDCRWKDTLRRECTKLRQEITEQKDEDKRAALAQLTKLKEDQFNAARDAWEGKVQELLNQISELRTQLDSHQQVNSEEMDKLRRAAKKKKVPTATLR